MRIAYIAHTRFPTEKAHGYQIAQVCQAMAQLGHSVTLLIPTIGNQIREDGFSYYGIPASFEVVQLPSFDALSAWFVPGKLAFALAMQSYKKLLRDYLLKNKFELLYVRSPILLPLLLSLDLAVIIELHELPRFGNAGFVESCNRCRRVVCLTQAMAKELQARGVETNKILVEGDAVDLDRFRDLPAQNEARDLWQLPSDKPIIGYVGSLLTRDTMDKGIDQLIQALSILKKSGASCFGWIVGGPTDAAEKAKLRAVALGLSETDIRFQNRIAASEVPSALAACSILVYPAPVSDEAFFRRDTSPLKLFEYAAANRPIVCANLPPIHDVFDETSVEFVIPGDAEVMAAGISRFLENSTGAQEKVKRAAEMIEKHTWKNRMDRILFASEG